MTYELNRAIIQALLLTDGSLVKKRNQIAFANTSMILIERFKNLIKEVYNHDIQKSRIGIGCSSKQTLHLIQFKNKKICEDLLSDIKTYRTAPFNKTIFPEVSAPPTWLKFKKVELCEILRNLFDADGGASLRISLSKRKDCFELERSVLLSCKHPVLRKDYKKLISKAGIESVGESSDKVTITNKNDLTLFSKSISFSPGVLISFKSKHWQGMEKKKLLELMIKTYEFPYNFVQKFQTKENLYKYLKSISPQVNMVTES